MGVDGGEPNHGDQETYLLQEPGKRKGKSLERIQLLPRKISASAYIDENHFCFHHPLLASLAASILAITSGAIAGCILSVYGAAIFALLVTFALTFPLCMCRIDINRRRKHEHGHLLQTWELIRFLLYWCLAVVLSVELSNCHFTSRELEHLCDYTQLNDLNTDIVINNASNCEIFLFSDAIVPNLNYLSNYMDAISGDNVNCFCIAPLTNTSSNSSMYPIWVVNLERTTIDNCTCDATRASWSQSNQTHEVELVFDPYKSKMTKTAMIAITQQLGLPSNVSMATGYWGDNFYGDAVELQSESCRSKRMLLGFLFGFALLIASVEFFFPMWAKYRRQQGSLIRDPDDLSEHEYSEL